MERIKGKLSLFLDKLRKYPCHWLIFFSPTTYMYTFFKNYIITFFLYHKTFFLIFFFFYNFDIWHSIQIDYCPEFLIHVRDD